MNGLSWLPAPGGYRRNDGAADLLKVGRRWILRLTDGTEIKLPGRASFDHADRAMTRALGPRCGKPVGRFACGREAGHQGHMHVVKIANPEAV